VTNPRIAFRRDLAQAMRPCAAAGAELVLVGDFNEPFGSDPEGMSLITSQLQLTNLMASQHSVPPPDTCDRGTKCLDHALTSKSVCDSLHRAGYKPFNARLPSDHRGYFFDLQTDILFGNHTQEFATPLRRSLMLSILCFLNRLTEFIGRTSSWNGIVAMDSESLLKTLLIKHPAASTPPD
jgi:hypothetical protein